MADSDSKLSAYDKLSPADQKKVDAAVENFAGLSDRNKVPYDKARVRDYILEAASADPKKFFETIEVSGVQTTTSSIPHLRKGDSLSV